MTTFRPHLPARDVDLRLRRSLEELRAAEKNAVLWFAEVLHRKLYRELGHSSIHQYAAVSLGFGKSKTAQFIRLAESLRTLPRLRKSVAKGELSWTKAREVAKVASPKTEQRWITEARTTSRSDLERKVSAVRRQAQVARGKAGDQEMFAVVGNVCVKAGAEVAPEMAAEDMATEVPVDVSVRFTPEQYARYEALLEMLRKQGRKQSREELLLAGLESLAMEGRALSRVNGRAPKAPELSRVNASPYQVVVQVCEECEKAAVTTSRGAKPIKPGTLKAILCDSKIHKRGESKNRSTVPPSVRLAAFVRDRYRCRGSGCGSARFLNVHHIVPRESGGPNTLENLITLCSGCHRALHDLAERRGRVGRISVRSRRTL